MRLPRSASRLPSRTRRPREVSTCRATREQTTYFEDTAEIGVLGTALHQDLVASVEQLLSGGGRDAGTMLERLGLCTAMKGGLGHLGRSIGSIEAATA